MFKWLKIWNSNEPFNLLHTFKGHLNAVIAIIQSKDSEKLISGSCRNDNNIRVWNLVTYQCEKVISDIQCSHSLSILEISCDKILVGGYNQLTLVDLVNNRIDNKIENVEEDKKGLGYSFLILDSHRIACGCSDGQVNIYDTNEKTLTQSITMHTASISGLICDYNKRVYSCSYDNNIKLWTQ